MSETSVRQTREPKTAARRLCEALGFEMESSGNRWNLSYPDAADSRFRADEEGTGPMAWTASLTGEGVLGVLIPIAVSSKGFGLAWAEVWDICKYVPSYDPREGWIVEFTWMGGNVMRMLSEAVKAGRIDVDNL